MGESLVRNMRKNKIQNCFYLIPKNAIPLYTVVTYTVVTWCETQMTETNRKPAPETAKFANRSLRKAPTLQSKFPPILERFVPAPKLPGAAELGVLALQGLGAVPVQRR